MPVALGRLFVQAPAFSPLPYGLLSAASIVDETDEHWQGGVEYQPDPCDPSKTLEHGCPTTSDTNTKTPTSIGLGTIGNEPFTVFSWVRCSPVANWDQAETRVRSALANGEMRAVERAFWTGDAVGVTGGINPHLAANTAITESSSGVLLQPAAINVATGAPAAGVPFVEAVGLLEGALAACYGGVGVLHIPRWTLASLGAVNQVFQTGPRLHTLGGIAVAAGAGYIGTGPDGTTPPAGSAWLYATGAVALRRGPIMVTSSREQAVDKAENTLVLIAERTYTVGWDCCLFAVLADIGGFTPPLVPAP